MSSQYILYFNGRRYDLTNNVKNNKLFQMPRPPMGQRPVRHPNDVKFMDPKKEQEYRERYSEWQEFDALKAHYDQISASLAAEKAKLTTGTLPNAKGGEGGEEKKRPLPSKDREVKGVEREDGSLHTRGELTQAGSVIKYIARSLVSLEEDLRKQLESTDEAMRKQASEALEALNYGEGAKQLESARRLVTSPKKATAQDLLNINDMGRDLEQRVEDLGIESKLQAFNAQTLNRLLHELGIEGAVEHDERRKIAELLAITSKQIGNNIDNLAKANHKELTKSTGGLTTIAASMLGGLLGPFGDLAVQLANVGAVSEGLERAGGWGWDKVRGKVKAERTASKVLESGEEVSTKDDDSETPGVEETKGTPESVALASKSREEAEETEGTLMTGVETDAGVKMHPVGSTSRFLDEAQMQALSLHIAAQVGKEFEDFFATSPSKDDIAEFSSQIREGIAEELERAVAEFPDREDEIRAIAHGVSESISAGLNEVSGELHTIALNTDRDSVESEREFEKAIAEKAEERRHRELINTLEHGSDANLKALKKVEREAGDDGGGFGFLEALGLGSLLGGGSGKPKGGPKGKGRFGRIGRFLSRLPGAGTVRNVASKIPLGRFGKVAAIGSAVFGGGALVNATRAAAPGVAASGGLSTSGANLAARAGSKSLMRFVPGIGNIAVAGLDAYDAYSAPGTQGQKITRAATTGGGALGGAAAGAAIGAFGGPAAIVTVPVGAILGGLAGSSVGRTVGDALTGDKKAQASVGRGVMEGLGYAIPGMSAVTKLGGWALAGFGGDKDKEKRDQSGWMKAFANTTGIGLLTKSITGLVGQLQDDSEKQDSWLEKWGKMSLSMTGAGIAINSVKWTKRWMEGFNKDPKATVDAVEGAMSSLLTNTFIPGIGLAADIRSLFGSSKKEEQTIASTGGLSTPATKASAPAANASAYTGTAGWTMKDALRGLTPEQTAALAINTSLTESGHRMDVQNKQGYAGQYQFGSDALSTVGLIDRAKLDAAKARAKEEYRKKHGTSDGWSKDWWAGGHKAFLNDPSNWTVEGGLQTFLGSKEMQDKAFFDLAKSNIAQGFSSGTLTPNSSPENIAAFAKAAHLVGAGGANDYFRGGGNRADANGTTAAKYAEDARMALRALETNGSVSSVSEIDRTAATESLGVSVDMPVATSSGGGEVDTVASTTIRPRTAPRSEPIIQGTPAPAVLPPPPQGVTMKQAEGKAIAGIQPDMRDVNFMFDDAGLVLVASGVV